MTDPNAPDTFGSDANEITIQEGYIPGGLSRLCAIQSAYYARNWAFTKDYEAYVAKDMGRFLQRYDPTTDLILTVYLGQMIEGGIVIDGGENPEDSARLRWFILSENLRHQGLGRQLITRGMAFAADHGYRNVYLTTFDGLERARHLYEAFGFRLVHESSGNTWGRTVTEQRFEFTS